MSLLQAGLPAADINKMKYHLVGFSKGKQALQLRFAFCWVPASSKHIMVVSALSWF